ncbi:hypothetical protein Tco_1418734 [Tanacetum coccineum]
METQKPLLKDENGEEVDVHMYRSMIGSLMYLTSSRPDIILQVFTDSEYAEASLDKCANSITEAEYVARSSAMDNAFGFRNKLLDYVQLFMSLKVSAVKYRLVLLVILNTKAKKSVKLMMEKLFGMELELMLETDIQEKEQKESQKQTNPSTEWKGQSQKTAFSCMRTRSQARRLRQHQRQQQQVPPNLVEPPKDTMADNRTMAELLQAPTEGYEDANYVPEISRKF